MAELFRDSFESLYRWQQTTSTAPTIVAGRNGNALRLPSNAALAYFLSAVEQGDTLTVGVAFRVLTLSGIRDIVLFESDGGGTVHNRIRVDTTGAIVATRGTTALGTSASGLVVVNTWNYLEAQIKLSDTVGTVTVKLNGTTIINVSGQDTKNAGAKTVYDTVQLGAAGTQQDYDDFYLRNDTTFNGDITVSPPTSEARLARHSVRVLEQNTPVGPARLYRFSTRVLVSLTTAAVISGQADMAFTATATGAVPSFSGSGTSAMAFDATATGVARYNASGTASMAFGATATPAGVTTASGTAAMTFGASATGVASIPFGATASMTFAVTADFTYIAPGSVLARTGMHFSPDKPEIDFKFIGRATVQQPPAPIIGPVEYISPAWTPEPGALIGVIMTIPVYTDPTNGPFEGPADRPWFFVEDTLGGTSDWNVAVNYYPGPSGSAFLSLWQQFCAYAVAGPDPTTGFVTFTMPYAPAYLGWGAYPNYDHHVWFFELHGQSKQRPVGRVGVGSEGSAEIIWGEDTIFDPPTGPVTVNMSSEGYWDPANAPENMPSSSLVIGVVNQQLTYPAQYYGGPSGGVEPKPVGRNQPFTMSAPADWATIDQVPQVADPTTATSHALLAYRNSWATPTNTWLGETGLVPQFVESTDDYDEAIVADEITWYIKYIPQQWPLMAFAVEFRSHVLDPVPPVVTEFGVYVMGADNQWIDRTCDIRSIEIERGRSTYTDGFAAATLSVSFANFEGLYSAWNPGSIWTGYGGKYHVGIPISVWGYTGGVATPMFTGSTDSAVDTFPGTVDSQTVVQASDAFKGFARHTQTPLSGLNAWVGMGEYSGQRIHRYATDAGFTGPRAIETGWTRMNATTMEGNTLDKMREVGESEWGWLFVDEAGTLVFRQRDALQTDPRMIDPQWIFTDSHDVPNPHGLPMVCYQEPFELSVDEQSIINIAQVTASTPPEGSLGGSGGPLTAQDDESLAHYGPRTWTRTLPIFGDMLGVAQVVVMEYADDDKHIAALTFSALKDAQHRKTAVEIRINDRITVFRHYPGGYVLKQDLIVQGIKHTIVPTGEGRHQDPAVWDVEIRTATAALIANFGRWDEPSPEDGVDHGWDTEDVWGI